MRIKTPQFFKILGQTSPTSRDVCKKSTKYRAGTNSVTYCKNVGMLLISNKKPDSKYDGKNEMNDASEMATN